LSTNKIVIEHSVKHDPIQRTYLLTISCGEVWIYRPIAEDLPDNAAKPKATSHVSTLLDLGDASTAVGI
jgi:hypothetical protein